jgi:hypothetical protein
MWRAIAGGVASGARNNGSLTAGTIGVARERVRGHERLERRLGLVTVVEQASTGDTEASVSPTIEHRSNQPFAEAALSRRRTAPGKYGAGSPRITDDGAPLHSHSLGAETGGFKGEPVGDTSRTTDPGGRAASDVHPPPGSRVKAGVAAGAPSGSAQVQSAGRSAGSDEPERAGRRIAAALIDLLVVGVLLVIKEGS